MGDDLLHVQFLILAGIHAHGRSELDQEVFFQIPSCNGGCIVLELQGEKFLAKGFLAGPRVNDRCRQFHSIPFHRHQYGIKFFVQTIGHHKGGSPVTHGTEHQGIPGQQNHGEKPFEVAHRSLEAILDQDGGKGNHAHAVRSQGQSGELNGFALLGDGDGRSAHE